MRNTKSQFVSLLLFLVVMGALLTNGFTHRIFAQTKQTDVFEAVDPIANVLDEILDNYYQKPNINKVVEGALTGMMNSLDPHCSFIPADVYSRLKEDTEGEFEGVGIAIKLDSADKTIEIENVIPNSPAAKAGILHGDHIIKINGVSVRGISTEQAADKIRGKHGTLVTLTIFRRYKDAKKDSQVLTFKLKRDKIPLESVLEARLLKGGIAYLRIQDFKNNTAEDIAKNIERLNAKGDMKALILDLRWNPGGLLTASKDVAQLFLPSNTLVVYTKGRPSSKPSNITENLKFYTEKNPIIPLTMPMVVLTNEWTASAAEIVTGCLQYWKRAIIVGTKTYGKGSVQTIIPLTKPAGSALRLTTALYYTPAQVTINDRGILPDVKAPMSDTQQKALFKQMQASQDAHPNRIDMLNHGAVTGNKVTANTVEDTQLQKAVDLLSQNMSFQQLIKKYHKSTQITQVAAIPKTAMEDKLEAGVAP